MVGGHPALSMLSSDDICQFKVFDTFEASSN